MEDPGRWKLVDASGSVAVAVVLLAMGGWCGLEVFMVPQHMALFSELGSVELPTFTRLVWGASKLQLPMIAALVLLLGGFGALFAIRDRFRANVYGLVIALLLASLAVVVRFASWIPLFKVMQEVGH